MIDTIPTYHHLGGIASVTDTASLFQSSASKSRSPPSSSGAKEYADIQVPYSDSNNSDVRDFPSIMRKISKAKRMEETVKDAKRLKSGRNRMAKTNDHTTMMPSSSDYSTTVMSTFVGHDSNTMREMMMPTAAAAFSSASSTDPSWQQFFSSYGGGGGSALPGGYGMGSSSSAMMGMMMPSSSSHYQHSRYGTSSSSSAMSSSMMSSQQQHQQYHGGPSNDMISMSQFPPPPQPYLHNNSAYTTINNNNASGNSNETSAAWHTLALSMIKEGGTNDESPPTGDGYSNNINTSNHVDPMAPRLDPLPLSDSVGNNPWTTVATSYQQQQHQNHQASAGNDAVESGWKYPPPPEYHYH